MITALNRSSATYSTARSLFAALMTLASLTLAASAQAQETVCARVKIEIKQELTLERQAFEAEMNINNTTDTGVIENVSVVVKITDENGTAVLATSDPNDLTAKFYIRVSNKQNISDVDGNGTVNPKTTSTIDWLLIPAPGSAGTTPLGKKYLVGATLKYRFGGEDTVLEVSPDVITVKPLPLLTLDYFLTQDVWADDPLTAAIEPAEPFTLGVRVKNTGYSTAKSLKIDSAQPKIIENNQGLLINFLLTGSYLNDAPTQNTLLINFGDLAAGTSAMGRWVMETTLAGKFTEFTAKFSHSNELGGALTSILQATNAHFLIRDVRVDLAGRDLVRDFLAQDGDVIRVYESDGPDTLVTDRSGIATLTAGTATGGNATYRLSFPPTAGFSYVKLPDPFGGTKALGPIVRSDAKQLLPENVWLSKTRNEQTKQVQYWINFFDVNSTGVYDSQFQAPSAAPTPPVLQFVPDRTTKEKTQVSFLVEASSAIGQTLTLTAAPLPAGATFTQQAADPLAPGVTRAVFDWTPAKGTAGSYLISYTASNGSLSAVRSANIIVQADSASVGPGTPTLSAPLSGAQVTSLTPTLSVQPSTDAQDATSKIQFEVYSDAAETQLVTSTIVDKVPSVVTTGGGALPVPTTWVVSTPLSDNTNYWWRARAYDGSIYSNWVNGRFFVNTFNDPPDSFNQTSPVPNAEVSSLAPTLTWTNSKDKDGDVITYTVSVYAVMTYADTVTSKLLMVATNLPEDPSGSTSWVANTTPLSNHGTYLWRVTAKDALGAQTSSGSRSFVVNTGNTAPSSPGIASPAIGSQSTNASTALTIVNSVDADHDLLTYVFEIDTVNTFDSAAKRSSGQVFQVAASGMTTWVADGLVENAHYWWRVKAQDGRAESAWTVGNFVLNAVNESPPVPTVRNPSNGAWSATQQPSLEANPVIDPDGDPVSYQFEIYRVDAAAAPGSSAVQSYTLCAGENGYCAFSGTQKIAYGVNNIYAFRTATNGIACNNEVFGDPVVGLGKSCYVVNGTASTGAGPNGPGAGYKICAYENQLCIFTGRMRVAYGALGSYVYQDRNNSVMCDSSTFGDPSVGNLKACYTPEAASNTPGAGYIYCAGENGLCKFGGTQRVAYGANGVYTYRTFTNGTACDNNTFGDPNVGVVKACYIAPPANPDNGPGAGYKYCANENGYCNFTGTQTVVYGANGSYSTRSGTNGIACTNSVFGDPIIGTVKVCYVGPTPSGGSGTVGNTAQKVSEGTSATPALIVPAILADKTTYWWHVRAIDPQGAASDWSQPSTFFVSTAPYLPPSIAVTSPSGPTLPEIVGAADTGVHKQLTVLWEGVDPNIEPTVALYYSTTNTSFAGTLIIDGLHQGAGAQAGSYIWDVTSLASGTYYIYAVIYDAKGSSQVFAPGALVIPNVPQSGALVVTAAGGLRTSDTGPGINLTVRLASQPTADVIVPISSSNSNQGVPSPASLTFTAANWSVNQTVAVTGKPDCMADHHTAYGINAGPAQSLDANYIGLKGTPVPLANVHNRGPVRTTNNADIRVCQLTVVSQTHPNATTWEYVVIGEVINSGAAVNGITARIASIAPGIQVMEGILIFGAVSTGDTAKTNDSVTLRSTAPIPNWMFHRGLGIVWNVVTQ